MASKLAKIYNVDIEMAQIAGLLHDNAKEMSKEEMLKYVEENNIEINEFEKHNVKILHGKIRFVNPLSLQNHTPRLTQQIKRPCSIGGTCGWKHRRFDPRDRKLVSFIKLPCLVSVCVNLCHVRFFQNHANVRWLYILNTAVA